MTYAQGGLIQASDYNGFATSINSVWNTIYGQPVIAPVVAGGLINRTDWNQIYGSVANIAAHQGTTITSIPLAATGDLLRYYPQLPTNIAAVAVHPYNAATVGVDIVGTASRTTPWGTATAYPQVTSTVTITFADVAHANYYFNCGGAILLQCARTGGTGTADDISWTQLCSDIGTLGLPAQNTAQTIAGAAYTGFTQFGGGGVGPDVYLRNGYYQLTSTPTQYFRQFSSSGVYTSDNIVVNYSLSGAVITISIRFTDGTAGTGTIDGNLTVTAVARPPESTYIANTWGTPVINVTAAV